jgi:putative membrane protein
MHGDVGAGWMILMMALMVLFWGAIILGIAGLIRSATQRGSPPPERRNTWESPAEILERRFAEGVLSLEDYRARREVLLSETAESNGAAETGRGIAVTEARAGGIHES